MLVHRAHRRAQWDGVAFDLTQASATCDGVASCRAATERIWPTSSRFAALRRRWGLVMVFFLLLVAPTSLAQQPKNCT
ncbi:MAG: hypothetical protein ACRDQ4_04965 [Pseudonocardiaceae bacterium]